MWWVLALYLACSSGYEHRVPLPDEATCKATRALLLEHHRWEDGGWGVLECLAPGEERDDKADYCGAWGGGGGGH